MTNASVLTMPNPIGDFVVCIDASLEGVGVVLMQDGRVIAYESRKLKDHEHSLVHWRNFLLGHKF